MNNSSEDRAVRVMSFMAKAGLSFLPAGGIWSELFTLLVGDPASKRRDEFMADVLLRLKQLEESGHIRLEDVAGNEEVSAILLQAGSIAQRSAGHEKLKALKDAAIRGTCNPSERTAAMVTLNVLDRLTDVHIYILRGMEQFGSRVGLERINAHFDAYYFGQTSPQAIAPQHERRLTPMAGRLHPNSETFRFVWQDLVSLGLLEEEVVQSFFPGGTPAGRELMACTTTFGRSILKGLLAEA